MKRSTRFAVSILAAAITFGSLMVFAKPMHGFREYGNAHTGYRQHYDCNRGGEQKLIKQGQKQGTEPVKADSARSGQ
jgi:hypothetical protein